MAAVKYEASFELPLVLWYAVNVEEMKDAIYHEQLARVARLKADGCEDRYLAVRLREAAIKHERKARQLRRNSVT